MTHEDWIKLTIQQQNEFMGIASTAAVRGEGLVRFQEAVRSIPMQKVLDDVGVSRSVYYAWMAERSADHHRYPNVLQFSRLSLITGYSPSWIITEVGMKFLFAIPELIERASKYSEVVEKREEFQTAKELLIGVIDAITWIEADANDTYEAINA